MEKSNDILIPAIERLIQEGHMVEFVPRGTSMRPFIEGGQDSVLLRDCQTPRVGLIVLARVEEQYVLHRIVKIEGHRIILQGDGNLQGQEYCRTKDIIGQVVKIKGAQGRAKRLTRVTLWHHLPVWIKRIVLKIYRHLIEW